MSDQGRGVGPDEAALDAAFATMQGRAPGLPGGLAARILADAAAVQTGNLASARRAPGGAMAVSLWRATLAALGGWGGVSGLAAAAAAGIWIGFAGFGSLGGTAAALWSGGTASGRVELMPDGADFLIAGIGQEG